MVVLTTFEDDAAIGAALQAGARSFLTKGATTQDIRLAVHAAAGDQDDGSPLGASSPP